MDLLDLDIGGGETQAASVPEAQDLVVGEQVARCVGAPPVFTLRVI